MILLLICLIRVLVIETELSISDEEIDVYDDGMNTLSIFDASKPEGAAQERLSTA